MDVSVAESLAWMTSNCGRIGAIGSSPSNGLKPNMWGQKGFNPLCQCVYIYVCIVNPNIQTIYRCSHTSIHTHTHTHIYTYTNIEVIRDMQCVYLITTEESIACNGLLLTSQASGVSVNNIMHLLQIICIGTAPKSNNRSFMQNFKSQKLSFLFLPAS